MPFLPVVGNYNLFLYRTTTKLCRKTTLMTSNEFLAKKWIGGSKKRYPPPVSVMSVVVFLPEFLEKNLTPTPFHQPKRAKMPKNGHFIFRPRVAPGSQDLFKTFSDPCKADSGNFVLFQNRIQVCVKVFLRPVISSGINWVMS